MSLLLAENISCVRARPVFFDLSFTLLRGGLLHLEGGNGTGKSSLLLLCAGLLEKQSGRLARTSALHFIGTQNGLHAKMSVAANMKFWASLMGKKIKAPLVEEALDFWGVAGLADLAPSLLSEGQKRAVALARLLLVPRPLWLLDEPFRALDTRRCALLEQALAAHCADGGAVLIAEHHKIFKGEVLDMERFS